MKSTNKKAQGVNLGLYSVALLSLHQLAYSSRAESKFIFRIKYRVIKTYHYSDLLCSVVQLHSVTV